MPEPKLKLKKPREKRLSIRIPEYLMKKLEAKKKKTFYSLNLLIIEAIKKDLDKTI